MLIENREEFVDMVAQAVIDRIEEKDRLAGMVDLVVRRVMELQKQQAQAANENKEEIDHAGEQHGAFGTAGSGGCH